MILTRNNEHTEKVCITTNKRGGQAGQLLMIVVAAQILTTDALSVICTL